MGVKIGYSLRASNTPAFELIAEGWNEIVQEGSTPLGQGVCPTKETDEVVFAVSNEGDIVGFIAFEVTPDAAVLKLSYVEPSSRRKGIYTELFTEVVKLAKTRGLLRLQSSIGLDNKAMQAVMRHTGRQIVTTLFELSLEA